jgi:hypothetical protein
LETNIEGVGKVLGTKSDQQLIKVRIALHCIALHHIALHRIAFLRKALQTRHTQILGDLYSELTLRCVALRGVAFALHCICIAFAWHLHCICIALRCVALRSRLVAFMALGRSHSYRHPTWNGVCPTYRGILHRKIPPSRRIGLLTFVQQSV